MKAIKQYLLKRFSVILIELLFLSVAVFGQQKYEFLFQNPDLILSARVDDLVGRMTLDEKISQMMDVAPAMDRLGIPAYNWWNECLHGVARSGLATVFPQAIGLGATWDQDLICRVGTVISDEARAKYHEYIRNNSRARYQGLTFWSPNINIFRDPRWGRGQETYGEDPFLTGKIAVQFIKGLQGNDPKYFKVVSTIKHYAVHSGPEPARHSFDAVIDERDLRETYLPQFEMGIKEGKAYSVMCAYNSFLGKPCCSSDQLLTNILRNEWGFKGYIVSDCGAIADIYRGHKYVSTADSAASVAVRAGTDLECSNVYRNLKTAVANRLVSEKDIDVSVKRLFTARFMLGMFDPPEMVKYAQIPYSVVDCKENKQLALETARKSMVLLKNQNNILPLKKNCGTVVVIGPNSDQTFVLLGNYNGTPSDPITPLRGIKEKLAGTSEVLWAQGCDWAAGLTAQQRPAEELKNEALEAVKKANIVIMCMGITPRLEGEEMRVNIDGFKGGDRTSLDLPAVQEELIKAVYSLGKPVILVLLNGSALSINWEKDNIPVILESWYGGQAAGQAIADVIFGDYNPGGRLPVTFYKSVNDLPSFDDYSMKNRTYRYFTGEPLFPFGYGLSYTTFDYNKLQVSGKLTKGDSLKVTVNVKNTGKVAGDEVVQLYLSNLDAIVPVPIHALKAFKRISLLPGETKTVVLTVAPDAFSIIDNNNKRVILPGKFQVFVGGRQPGNKGKKSETGILKSSVTVL
jgi:beta-glucosidase